MLTRMRSTPSLRQPVREGWANALGTASEAGGGQAAAAGKARSACRTAAPEEPCSVFPCDQAPLVAPAAPAGRKPDAMSRLRGCALTWSPW